MEYDYRVTFSELKRQVVLKMGQGDISQWRTSQYTYASEVIQAATNEYISAITLKRVFGKIDTNDGYLPHLSTLNILAKYLGFPDYVEFVKSLKVQPDLKPLEYTEIPNTNFMATFRNWLSFNRFWVSLGFTFLLIILFGVYILNQNKKYQAGLAKPYFEFEILDANVDSLWVDVTYLIDFSIYPKGKLNQIYFSDGKFEIMPYRKRTTLTHRFARADMDIYKAIVLIDAKNIATKLFVPDSIPPHGQVKVISNQNSKHITEINYPQGVDTMVCIYNYYNNLASEWATLKHSANYRINNNSFIFTCKAKRTVSLLDNEKCHDVILTLYFEADNYLLRFRESGCFFKGFPKMRIGSLIIDKNHDSYKNFNFANADIIDIAVKKKGKVLEILSDSTTIFKSDTMPNLGNFLGIKFMVKGTEMLYFSQFKVSDFDQTVIYNYKNAKFNIAAAE